MQILIQEVQGCDCMTGLQVTVENSYALLLFYQSWYSLPSYVILCLNFKIILLDGEDLSKKERKLRMLYSDC